MVILDTDILIEFYKGNSVVKREIENLQADIFYLSSITVAEFIVGARNKEDQKRIEKELSNYTILPVNAEINDIFIDFVQTFALSHRPGIPDALIAATALYYHLPLFTYNKRHFQFIPGIELV